MKLSLEFISQLPQEKKSEQVKWQTLHKVGEREGKKKEKAARID